MRLKGGKQNALNNDQSKENASMANASGSGFHETYFLNCALTREANKSTSQRPNRLMTSANTCVSKCHSMLCLSTRDSASASIFRQPGKCVAVTQLLCDKHHNQMSLAMSLHKTFVLPMLLIQATVVLLSVSN